MLHEGTTDGDAQDSALLPAVELVPAEAGIEVEFEPGFGDELIDGSRQGLAKFLQDGRARGPGLIWSRLGEAPGASSLAVASMGASPPLALRGARPARAAPLSPLGGAAPRPRTPGEAGCAG